YPSLDTTMMSWPYLSSSATRCGDAGLTRHSKTLASITSAPGIPPSRLRCSKGRMPTSSAPASPSCAASSAETRVRLDRVEARISSIDAISHGTSELDQVARLRVRGMRLRFEDGCDALR